MAKYIHQKVTIDTFEQEKDVLLSMTEKKFYKLVTDVICINTSVFAKDKPALFDYLIHLRPLAKSYYIDMLNMFAVFQVSQEILTMLVYQKDLLDEVYAIFAKGERHLTLDAFLWNREEFVEQTANIGVSREAMLKLYQLYKIRDSLQYLQYVIHCKPETVETVLAEA